MMRLELEHRMDAVSFQHVAELSAPADSFSSLQKKPSIPRKIQKTKDRKFFVPLDLWFLR